MKDFSTSGHKVTMMSWLHTHITFNNIVLKIEQKNEKIETCNSYCILLQYKFASSYAVMMGMFLDQKINFS
jgi:hypothetical protein